MSDRETLLSFGFEAPKVERALKATNNAGLQQALDWLEKHGDEELVASDEESDKPNPAATPDPNLAVQSKSLKCSECDKIFANDALASYHADKSGHHNFEESTEEIKPLTPAEKEARLTELREKMKVKKKAEQAIQDEQAKKDRDIRKKGGKDMHQIKQELEIKEAAKKIAQDKQDKLNDAKAKARVKAQIEEDKKRRLEKAAEEKAKREGQPVPTSAVSQSIPVSKPTTGGSGRVYTEARLQLRLPDQGQQPLVFNLKSDQTLNELVDKLFDHSDFTNFSGIRKGNVRFSTSFPRKMFNDSEMIKPIKELGLMPSAALVVTYI